MGAGPATKKTLKTPKLPTVTLELTPTETAEGVVHPAPQPALDTVIVRSAPTAVYFICVTCGGCDKPLNFGVRTSKTSILTLQTLLTKDLHLLCARCNG